MIVVIEWNVSGAMYKKQKFRKQKHFSDDLEPFQILYQKLYCLNEYRELVSCNFKFLLVNFINSVL